MILSGDGFRLKIEDVADGRRVFGRKTHKESPATARLPLGNLDSAFAETGFENESRASPDVTVGDVCAEIVDASSPVFVWGETAVRLGSSVVEIGSVVHRHWPQVQIEIVVWVVDSGM